MILVTGATGQIGSHVLYELAKAGKPVRAMYRNNNGIEKVKQVFSFYQNDGPQLSNLIEWVQADIIDPHALENSMQGIRQVYHSAGVVSFDDRDRKKLNRVNTGGTTNIVNACLQSGAKLCHVSSIASLGELAVKEPVDENVIWNRGTSASAYAMSKYNSEMEVWRGIHEGLDAVIVNPSVIIGPGMWSGPGKYLFYALEKGIKYYPPGSSGYVDVRDVARIMILLCESGISGERYILNAGHMAHREFMSLIAKAFGKKGPDTILTPLLARIAVIGESLMALVTGNDRRINPRTFGIASEELRYSSSKITKALGVTFTSIEDSVNSAVQIFKRFRDK